MHCHLVKKCSQSSDSVWIYLDPLTYYPNMFLFHCCSLKWTCYAHLQVHIFYLRCQQNRFTCCNVQKTHYCSHTGHQCSTVLILCLKHFDSAQSSPCWRWCVLHDDVDKLQKQCWTTDEAFQAVLEQCFLQRSLQRGLLACNFADV